MANIGSDAIGCIEIQSLSLVVGMVGERYRIPRRGVEDECLEQKR